jgi:hypothetical protein
MIGNYIRQYNQANNQINHLYSVLADIRRNIDHIYNTQVRQTQTQRRTNNLEQYDFNVFNIPLRRGATTSGNNNLLTTQEIEQYTLTTTFSDIVSPINTECPIRLEEFNDNDTVTQIRHCGHIFNAQELNNWFLTNNRCPVCRHNLRISNTRTRTDNNYNASLITQLLTGIFEDYNVERDLSPNNDT